MDFKDRALVLGSFRLEGEVLVTKGGATLETIPTQQINLDGMVGAHSFVENYTTSIRGGCIIENITDTKVKMTIYTANTSKSKTTETEQPQSERLVIYAKMEANYHLSNKNIKLPIIINIIYEWYMNETGVLHLFNYLQYICIVIICQEVFLIIFY